MEYNCDKEESTWMNLQGIILNEKVSPKGYILNDCIIEMENRLVFARS